MPVASVVAGISAVGAVGSAVVQSNAAQSSADAIAKGAKDSNALQSKIYEESKAGFQPFVSGGYAALDPLLASYGFQGADAQQRAIDSFHSAPDYQFSLDEGLKGVEGSASARGGLYSGGALKALDRYGSNYANTYLNNWRTGLRDIAGMGANAVGSQAGLGKSYADAYGANTMKAAGGQADAYAAQGDAWGGAINDVAQAGGYAYGRANGWYDPVAGSPGGSPGGTAPLVASPSKARPVANPYGGY